MKATPVSFTGLPDTAVAEIAALFGAEAQLQLADHPTSGPLWRIEHRSENGNLRLLLWPAIARVDVTCGPHTWIARGVSETHVLAGIEAIFHFGTNRLADGRADRSRHDDRAVRTMSPRAHRARHALRSRGEPQPCAQHVRSYTIPACAADATSNERSSYRDGAERAERVPGQRAQITCTSRSSCPPSPLNKLPAQPARSSSAPPNGSRTTD